MRRNAKKAAEEARASMEAEAKKAGKEVDEAAEKDAMQKLRLKMHADLHAQRQEANAADDKLRAQEDEVARQQRKEEDELRSGKREDGKGVRTAISDRREASTMLSQCERAN